VPNHLDSAAIAPVTEDFASATPATSEADKAVTYPLLPIQPPAKFVDNINNNAGSGNTNELLQVIKEQFTQIKETFASPYNNSELATMETPDTLEPVTVSAPRRAAQPAPAANSSSGNNNSNMMMMGMAALAVVLLARK
jgi:hypothetical protein